MKKNKLRDKLKKARIEAKKFGEVEAPKKNKTEKKNK